MTDKVQIKNPDVLINIKQTLAQAEAAVAKFNMLVATMESQIHEMETGANLRAPKRRDWSHVRSWGKEV